VLLSLRSPNAGKDAGTCRSLELPLQVLQGQRYDIIVVKFDPGECLGEFQPQLVDDVDIFRVEIRGRRHVAGFRQSSMTLRNDPGAPPDPHGHRPCCAGSTLAASSI